MTFTPERSQLRGLSVETASLYGMPSIGCRYIRDDIRGTSIEDTARCACCGAPAANAHHEPPRSKGTFLMATQMGTFVLYPALIALCGSGTQGCHGKRHNGRLRIRWEWDSDGNAEKWWSGFWLSHGYEPHSPRLFELGRYVFDLEGREMEVRR